MVEKARSNIFSVFMRKIGYSVGLENTLERVFDFANLYGCNDTIGYGDITRLLHAEKPDGWGLDKKNEHILDLFKALGIVEVRRGEVSVLELGDALGILRRMVTNEDDFLVCCKVLLIHSLILADGDIFLNAIASSFDAEEFKKNVVAEVEYKWSVLESNFNSSSHRAAFYSAVNIESQPTNPGSKGKGLSSAPDLMRLKTFRGGSLLAKVGRPDVYIPDSYVLKVLPRRKAWATSLGLVDNTGRATPQAASMLQALVCAGFAGPNCMAIWPLDHELRNPTFFSIAPTSFPRLNSWEFMVLVGRGLGIMPPKYGMVSSESQIEKLKEFIFHFKSLNKTKSIIRTELSVRVAYRCFLALSAIGLEVGNVPEIIISEQEKSTPGVIARPSGLAEMALSR
jgi:hypothetical protein